jgi:hypothetical protein
VDKLGKKVLKPKKKKLRIHNTSLIGSEELNFRIKGFRKKIIISSL